MANLGLTFRIMLTCFPKWRPPFAFSNLNWQMRTSKLREAMAPAKDLTGFCCQTRGSNPHLMSPKPVLLIARQTWHLLLWLFPRKWESHSLVVLICVSWGLKALLLLPASRALGAGGPLISSSSQAVTSFPSRMSKPHWNHPTFVKLSGFLFFSQNVQGFLYGNSVHSPKKVWVILPWPNFNSSTVILTVKFFKLFFFF